MSLLKDSLLLKDTITLGIILSFVTVVIINVTILVEERVRMCYIEIEY